MSQGEMDAYRELIRENIGYDNLVRERSYAKRWSLSCRVPNPASKIFLDKAAIPVQIRIALGGIVIFHRHRRVIQHRQQILLYVFRKTSMQQSSGDPPVQLNTNHTKRRNFNARHVCQILWRRRMGGT